MKKIILHFYLKYLFKKITNELLIYFYIDELQKFGFKNIYLYKSY